MDEPTTHLDLASVDALLLALQQFEGTLLLISHDVYFIRELANHVVHIQDGRLTHYPGDYQYYLDKTAALRAAVATERETSLARKGAAATENRPAQERRERKRLDAERRQARHRELTAARTLVRGLEQDIAACEARQAQLTAELEKPETYAEAGRAVAINLELKRLLEDLPGLTADWEVAATRLAELEAVAQPSLHS
jgi:ATP-binding cassette subfamily F protein 3